MSKCKSMDENEIFDSVRGVFENRTRCGDLFIKFFQRSFLSNSVGEMIKLKTDLWVNLYWIYKQD